MKTACFPKRQFPFRLLFRLVFLLIFIGGIAPPVQAGQLSSTVTAVNLAPNPSFEQGSSQPNGWSHYSNGATYTWSSATVHTGTHSICISNLPATTSGEWFSQSIPVQPGKTYYASIWVKGSSDREAYYTISPKDTNGNWLTGSAITIPYTNSAWTFREFSFTAPANAASVILQPGYNNPAGNSSASICFDDITFQEYGISSLSRKVQPILFVPKNLATDPLYAPSINSAMATIRTWYASQLGGRTFNYVPTQVVIGQHDLNYYCPKTTVETQCIQIPGQVGADPGDINNVLTDLADQGYSILQDRILLVFWVGGYGYAGGTQSSPSSGFAALGDWALDGLAGKYEAGTATSRCSDSQSAAVICKKNAQIGSVAHELGHAFGLPHPTDDGTQPGDPNYWLSTIMSVYWDFPTVVLINSTTNPEKTRLLEHPFFWLFADVSPTAWTYSYIESLYKAGITGGCSTDPLQYCPSNPVNRAQMAVFLLRAEHGSTYKPPDATGKFLDVPKTDFTAPFIEQLAKEGITGGCGGGKFCPANPVTRAQMAIFLLRAEHGSTYAPPSAIGMFLDVPKTDFTAPFIEQLANEKITGGCGGTNYCPGNPVTRDQMAVFLVRTFKLP